ncbi:hypothetical protein BDZ85DRAFT_264468 [Elsinoe ampelina]|uniref:Uncharacterized protein n=1 Tax=Elsinoe ampelina TaxID=302913 RepID=A0A6A6G834_9PEZI|nr:hypothetical protein BDZ85DRAFT_264468 [Elsinoe ampelina]
MLDPPVSETTISIRSTSEALGFHSIKLYITTIQGFREMLRGQRLAIILQLTCFSISTARQRAMTVRLRSGYSHPNCKRLQPRSRDLAARFMATSLSTSLDHLHSRSSRRRQYMSNSFQTGSNPGISDCLNIATAWRSSKERSRGYCQGDM